MSRCPKYLSLNCIPILRARKRYTPAYAPLYLLADSRDYYYVPAMYIGGDKLYEAAPGEDYETIRENLRRVFEQALKD